MTENRNEDVYTSTNVESAIIQGNENEFYELIDSVDITHRSNNNSNLLHKAANVGEPEFTAELIERGVDMDAQDYENKTPLHRAIEKGHTDVAKILINNGCSVGIEDEYGAQPLLRAVQNANIELTELLVKNGADPSHETKNGLSPRDIAEEFGIEKLTRLCTFK